MPIDNSLVQFQLDYIELLIGIKIKLTKYHKQICETLQIGNYFPIFWPYSLMDRIKDSGSLG